MRKLFIFLIFFFMACLSCLAATEYTFDKNKDGNPDQWYEYEQGKVINEQLDTNFDGKIDYRAEFDKLGRKKLEEFDMNFDGQMDDVYHYDEGKLTIEEIDTNYDGKTDIWIYLLDGNRISKYEQDTNFDGTVDKVKQFGQK